MALKDVWIDKIDDVDDILAEHINSVARAVIDNEISIEEHNQTLSDIKKTTDNHEARIAEIEEHLAPKYIITDETTAYRKNVPLDVCHKVQLNSIGGMTYKSDNLIPFPYKDGAYGEGFTTTQNGATLTVRAYGGIAISGKPTGHGAMRLWEINDLSTINEIITASVQGTFTNMVMTLTVTFEDDTTQVIQLANSGTIIKKSDYPTAKKFVFEVKRNNNNVAMSGICYPMINPGETVLPWTPYFEGLRDSAVTALKIHGANMLGGEALKDAIKSGIPNATVDEANKTISFTAREASGFKFTDVKPNTQYTVILYGKNGTAGTKTTNIIFRYADGTYTSLGFTTADVMSYAVGQNDTTKNLVEISGTYGSGSTILEYEKCGIFEGNIPLEQFRPYIEPTTIPIPEAIQALPNYGKMFTYLDLINKNYTDASYPVHLKIDDENDSLDNHLEMVDEFEYLAGAEDWKEGDIAAKAKLRYYVNPMDSLPELGVLIAKGNYTNVTYDGYYLIFDAYTYDVNTDEYVSNWYGTITEIEAVFGTDTDYLITVEDVSDRLSEDLEIVIVEDGGSIEFVNTHKNAVPSSVSFMKDGHLLKGV